MAALLVVDDEPGVREFLVDALVSDGHDVTEAGDGLSAIRALAAERFDVMITDLRMPGEIDGVDLVRAARRDYSETEIIVLTAFAAVDTAVTTMKLGAFDYLEKPLGSPAEPRMLVRQALARAGGNPRDLARRKRRPAPAAGADPIAGLALDVASALGPDYQVGDVIGRGGYGVVFQVWDRRLHRNLAVKALLPELAVIAGLAERFRREAETAAGLNHPNIVPVYFVGSHADVPCFVMPMVEGESLSTRLRRDGQLRLSTALQIATDVASALDCAHQAGVIHRDVKPDNILLERATGRSLLTDFGVAKALIHDSLGTAPGTIIGTPHYVSPEQVAGDRDVDARSDLYSFAVVVYEMLAGAPPFDGKNSLRIFAQHVSAPVPPLRGRRPGLASASDLVMAKALAKDPAERFATGGGLVGALNEAWGRPSQPHSGAH